MVSTLLGLSVGVSMLWMGVWVYVLAQTQADEAYSKIMILENIRTHLPADLNYIDPKEYIFDNDRSRIIERSQLEFVNQIFQDRCPPLLEYTKLATYARRGEGCARLTTSQRFWISILKDWQIAETLIERDDGIKCLSDAQFVELLDLDIADLETQLRRRCMIA